MHETKRPPYLTGQAPVGRAARRLRSGIKLPAALLLAAAIGLGGTAGGVQPAAYAAVSVPKLDNIRVALFIDTGKYVSPAAAVTLSADAGLQLGLRGAAGEKPVHQAAARTPVRVYADGYYAQLPETGDVTAARSQAKKLTAGGVSAGIVQRVKRGQSAYRAYVGPFATKEAAASAAAGQPGASISGPLRWNAGSFAGEAEANAQAVALSQAGFDADVALTEAGYAVFVGEAADNAALQALKAQIVAALPTVALAPVDAAQSYVLKRSELDAGGENAGGPLAAFAFGGGAKLWAAAADAQGGITVRERFDRGYRGGIELSLFNGKLAVINELPLEQYLVSVLGSEMSKEWPLEALKAQAVAARTFALKQGVKYQIAHVTDTTTDQAYKGLAGEFAAAQQAVQATQGEVLVDKNGLINPLYYSNAGGMTAAPTEVWGNEVAYLKSQKSPDEGAQAGKKAWYRIVLPNGTTGYIHSDYARATGQKNPAGLPYYESTATGVSVRPAPYVDNATNPAAFKVDIGDRFVVIDQEVESNAYSWVRGPYGAAKLKEKLGAAYTGGALNRLEVSKRGPSGRALEVTANGQPLKAAYPDSLRTLLGGLPSTRFDIEETGRYTILGAGGATRSQTPASQPVVVAGSGGAGKQTDEQLFMMNAQGKVRMATRDTQFIFKGTGYGHGLGMSQWGAKGYAEQGYDYQKILLAYYTGVSIQKAVP
ncbi:SpoIID/LytB domain-containing protein [Paenibacillus ehimensis]|uniref:SpoIID/LytB domain-containing protein n=1 Tax=Paenibacillus ehimensis TaxID=79264 RepID=A0ABT8VEB4_9BACL|nr:SpoIID/LytB domain-containing protein [Paenibacillus ehimensis]MDO3679326.1 SpoIID/LytB domain-containing protein [Paenibacillus ehimensis]